MSKRTLLLGGLAIAAVAGALKNRHRVAGLIGVRSGDSEPPPPESATYAPPEQTRTPLPDEPAPAPAPSNYDIGGPAANTATAVPAPEPLVHGEGGIDEAAEEAAAAAEAAAIGGDTPQYAGPAVDEPAEEKDRAVAESGGGDAEGQEQAEADLQDNAEPAAGDPIEGSRRIEDAIESADDPASGEAIEALEEAPTGAADPGGGQETFFAGGKGQEGPEEGAAPGLPNQDAVDAAREHAAEPGTPEGGGDAAASETPAEKKSSAVWAPSQQKDDDEGEWQTWSGRASDS